MRVEILEAAGEDDGQRQDQAEADGRQIAVHPGVVDACRWRLLLQQPSEGSATARQHSTDDASDTSGFSTAYELLK